MFKQINSSNDIAYKEYVKLKYQNDILEKELQESKGVNWILSQVIKACGALDAFESLMKNITDILMGILGVDTCTIWIKRNNDYISYCRSIYNENKYEVKENEILPDFLLKIKETGYFDVDNKQIEFCKGKNVRSIVVAPLEDFRMNNRLGIVIAEHRTKDFFTKTTINFFSMLAIQISIAAVNAKLFEKVNEITNKDILTNCYNRKYFEKLMLNMNTTQKYYTLAIYDLDNFKKVNDLYGHQKGDEILVEISNLAIKIVEKHKGEVIRFGGDEFVILLFKPLRESLDILENFREAVPNLEVVKEMDVDITTTIGVSSYSETVSQMKDVFSTADMALIKGKKNGEKNKIHVGYDENKRAYDF